MRGDDRWLGGDSCQPQTKQSRVRGLLSRPKILSKCLRVYNAVSVAATICHGEKRSVTKEDSLLVNTTLCLDKNRTIMEHGKVRPPLSDPKISTLTEGSV